MNHSPLQTTALFHIGPVAITEPVIVTWVIMAFLVLFAVAVTRRLSLLPSKAQTVLELFVGAIDSQIRDTMQVEPGPYRALIGTIFIFILVANWSSLVPGVEAPTAHLETDAAFGAIVFFATIFYGVRALGLSGYLATFTKPTWVMIPLNIVEQITRTFSLIIRLFGNVMSGVFIGAIVLSLAGLFVPIPFMALDLLTGAIQAYIFTVLAMVYIGAALAEGRQESPTTPNRK
jgi:F-type H+-transporting ATPase subunit a